MFNSIVAAAGMAVAVATLLAAPMPAHAADAETWRVCNGNYGATIVACTSIIGRGDKETARDLAIAFHHRGVANRLMGNLDDEIADYSQAIRLDPKYADVFRDRGEAYYKTGDFDRAIADFEEAVRLEPKQEDKVWHYRSLATRLKRQLDQDIADYSSQIMLDPSKANPYVFRGVVYERKADLARAAADFEKALSLEPNHAGARAGLGRVRATLAKQPPAQQKSIVTAQRQEEALVTRPQEQPSARLAILEKRVALVIGNGAHEAMPRLPNPVNDATDIATALRGLGFDVSLGLDLKRADMEDRLITFAKAARTADAALVFYAGHGLQHQGINYLAPVDTRLTDEADLLKMIKVQALIQNLQGAKNAGILILDACRDNEAVTKLTASLPRNRAAGFRGGLAEEKADGILIAFATQPDRFAADGNGRNSPFTAALLKHINTPGIDARVTFTRVRGDVFSATSGGQRPEVSDSLIGEFVFKP